MNIVKLSRVPGGSVVGLEVAMADASGSILRGHLGADFSLSSLSMKNMTAGGFIKWTCYSLCNVRGHPPSIVQRFP